MRNAQGYAVIVEPDGIRESDTFTCNHCQHVVHVKAYADPAELGGFCTLCSKHICKYCLGKGCMPWEKKMELMERRRP